MSDRPPLPHADLAAYAHELRGALTVIAGYAELLRRPLDELARTSALDGIDRAIRRADALCSDALAGRTLSASSVEKHAPLSLTLLAEQVAADQRTSTGRTIDVTTQGAPGILGDADAIACVLSNLIDNAAKYSLSWASIEVRAAEEEGPSGRIAVLEVADRGPGIPEAEIGRVVEPFARLERDADLPGTGLGLGIVQSAIAAHHGTLAILPREGGGTVIRLEFPQT